MDLWLEVRARMNGASWYDVAHHTLSISATTDVSFIGMGGVVRRPSGLAEVFRTAAEFPPEWTRSYNGKEAFALYDVLRLRVGSRPDVLGTSTLTMDVDNKTMFHAVQKGRAQNEPIHNLIRKFF